MNHNSAEDAECDEAKGSECKRGVDLMVAKAMKASQCNASDR
jgi:hypothetical protein